MKIKVQLALELTLDETSFQHEETGTQMTEDEILEQIRLDIDDGIEEFVSNYEPTILDAPIITKVS